MVLFNPARASFKVNSNTVTANTVTTPVVGIADNGNFVIVWQEPFLDRINDFDIRGAVFAPNGTIVVNERFIAPDLGSETQPAIAVAPNGRFGVTYVRNDDIFLSLFSADGLRQGNEILVSDFSQAQKAFEPTITVDTQGNFAIVWTSEARVNDLDIRTRSFSANGTPINDDVAFVSEFSNESQPSMAIARVREGRTSPLSGVVTFTNDQNGVNDIFVQLFGSNNRPQGSSFNAVSEFNRSRNQSQSSVAMDSSGNFVVAWVHEFLENDTDIHFRRFSSNGTPLDRTEIVVDSGFGNQTNPKVALANDDTIVITYQDESDNTIKFRQFDNQGTPLGDSQIVQIATEVERNPDIAIAPNNTMVITADGGNGRSFNPYAQTFRPTIGNNILNTPLNRFQNQDRIGTFLFATEAESVNIRQNFRNFQEEGVAFAVASQPGDSLVRFNRFQNRDILGTFLFATEAESQNIRRNFPNFIEEGIAFYAYGAGSNQASPFYRFQNTQQPGTFIFVGEEERRTIQSNFPNFVEEGIAFEAAI